MKPFARFRQCQSGAAAVEFALIGLVLVSLLLGIAEFGRALFIRNQLAFAADIGTRRLLVDPEVADADLERVIKTAISFPQDELELELGRYDVDGITFRTIALRQPLTLLIPHLYDAAITLRIDRQVPLPNES